MNTRRALTLSLVFATLVPAGIALYWCLAMPPASPEPWEWFSRARLNPLPLREGTLFDFEVVPRLVLFRLAYEGLLMIPGSDFGRFGAVGWLLVALTCVGVWRLAARSGGHRKPLLAAGLFALALAAFSPAFGANWLLGARFRVFFPAAAFVAGALLLTGGVRWRMRFAAAGLIALLGIFVDRTGVAVWIALVPLVVIESLTRQVRRPGLFIVGWFVLGNAAVAVAYSGVETSERVPSIVGRLIAAPGEAGRFVLGRLGSGAPLPTAGRAADEAAWVAGAVMLALLVVLSVVFLARWRRRPVLRSAAPWFACAVFAVVSALAVADQYYDLRDESALIREIGWSAFFLPVGIAGLVATLAGRAGRVSLAIIAPAAIVVLVAQWCVAWDTMHERQALLRQGEALLVFRNAATTELPGYPVPPVYYGVDVIALERHDRLRRPAPLASMALKQIGVGGPAGRRGRVTVLRDLTVHGESPRIGPAADLILLTRQVGREEEVIIRVAVPHRRGNEPTCEWGLNVANAQLDPRALLRVYAFDYDAGRAYRLPDRLRVVDGRIERVKEEGE